MVNDMKAIGSKATVKAKEHTIVQTEVNFKETGFKISYLKWTNKFFVETKPVQ
jgi:hypothetical protein